MLSKRAVVSATVERSTSSPIVLISEKQALAVRRADKLYEIEVNGVSVDLAVHCRRILSVWKDGRPTNYPANPYEMRLLYSDGRG
jgi:hypothetical protein